MPRVKYAMDYRPRNSFSMSCASRMVIFPGGALLDTGEHVESFLGSVQSGRLGVCDRVQSVMYFRAYLGACNKSHLAAWFQV